MGHRAALQAEQRDIEELEEKVMRDRQEGLLFKSLYGNRKVEKRLHAKALDSQMVRCQMIAFPARRPALLDKKKFRSTVICPRQQRMCAG